MKVQVNSDNTIAVDAGLTRFVEDKVRRVLGRFAVRLTRVEVHLSDVDNNKTGQVDKRCLIEARPAGAQPLVASANSEKLPAAVIEAVGKMQRLLATFFGRMGRTQAATSVAVSTAKNVTTKNPMATKTTRHTKKKAAVKKAAVKKRTKLSPRGPKKKRISQARRKAWPTR